MNEPTKATGINRGKKQKQLMTSFLVCSVGVLSYFAYLRVYQDGGQKNVVKSFSSLQVSVSTGDVKKFLTDKRKLRKSVAQSLKGKGEQLAQATNIATFLFPELLPADNFERAVAEEQWAPQQKAIEDNPRSEESRKHFNEMQANIWNYENPDRSDPKLSTQAKQVIRIYDLLSSK